MQRSLIARNPSVLVILALLALVTIFFTVRSEGLGVGPISTSFVKNLSRTLCLCLIAVAMDLIWGYADCLTFQLAFVVLVPGLLTLVF
jgi:urea transport system permease protein